VHGSGANEPRESHFRTHLILCHDLPNHFLFDFDAANTKLYIPPSFKEKRKSVLFDAIERVSFGTLVTSTRTGLSASHIPMIIDRGAGPHGTIYGHIAKANLQWRESVPKAEALAIFIGPDAYISPAWYQSTTVTGKVVPTWNYIAVQARGSVSFFHEEEKLRGLVEALTKKFEDGSERPWKMADAPPEYISQSLRAIVGFQMPIQQIEGKWKLGQNRGEADRKGAIAGLRRRGNEGDSELAREMEKAMESETKGRPHGTSLLVGSRPMYEPDDSD